MYKILTPNQAIPKAYLHDKPDVQEVMALVIIYYFALSLKQ